ncbi:MAG: hypothetical protein J5932_05375 [Prevotella sp.]|nr:hypothetical protein [Prevotella sp.]
MFLAVLGLVVGTMSVRAVPTTLFSTEAKAVLSVPASTTDMEISSTYATVTGGKMYVTNGQDSAKDLIATNSNAVRFAFLNNNTFFKVVLNDALQVGDVVHVNMQGGLKNGAWKGIWLSTQSSRPNSAPDSITTTNSSYTDLTYTIASGDELVGVSTFYIYRAAGATTYLTSMNITRDVLAAPTITTNLPATATVGISNATTFSIVATDATSYQWYKASGTTADIMNDAVIEGATAASYSYSAPAEGTEYIYCVATNDMGSTVSTVCAVTASLMTPVTFGLTRPLTAPAEEGGKGTMGASVWNDADGLITLSEIKGSEVTIDGQNRDYVINNVTYTATQSYRKDVNRSAFDEAQYAGYTFTVPDGKKLDLTSVSARLSDASNCTWTWKISVQDADSEDPATQIWGSGDKSTTGNSTTTVSISDAAFTNALSGLKSGTYQAKIYFYQGGSSKDNTIDLTFTGNLLDADPEVAEVSIPETAYAILNVSNSIKSTVNAYPAVTAYQWYSCDANGQNATAVEGATSSTLTFTPTAVGTEYYYLAATNAAGTANSNICTVTVIEEALFSDFSAILNNGTGTLITSDEITDKSSVSFGIAVDEDGKIVRVAADSPLSIATISGKYHSEHGLQNFKTIVKVPGKVKIKLGTCQWGGNVTIKNASNETVATVNTNNGTCYHGNTSTNMVTVYYEGDATTLTIEGGNYVPFVSISSVSTLSKYTVTFKNGEEIVDTKTIYNDGTDTQTLGTLPIVTADEGKRFRGWYEVTDGSEGKAVISTVPSGDMTYYAVFADIPTTTAGYYMPSNGLELANVLEYIEETSASSAKIFLKNGTYTLPRGAVRHYTHTHSSTGAILWDGDAYDPITYLNTSNISFVGQSRDGVVITNIEPNTNDYVFDGQYGSANIYEGIGKSDVIQIGSKVSGLYWQDLTVSTGMADAYGRDIAIQDKGTQNIYKNVCLHGYQDTWTSNNDNGLYYFEGGVVRGRTDYLCGKGDIYFNGVELRQLKGGYAAVPSKPANIGWVFKDCVINGDESDVNGNYTLGRPWGSGTPVAVFIDTKMNVKPSTIGWNEMSGGWPARFAEYNSMDADGNAISLSGRKSTFADTHSNNPVLTSEEADTYSDKDAMYGEWNPTQYTVQAEVSNVVLDGNTLTWEGSSEAYLIEKQGTFVALTTETSYTVDSFGLYTVRAANGRGGFGEASASSESGDITFAVAVGTAATALTSTASATDDKITEFTNIAATTADNAGKENLTVKLVCGNETDAAATVGFTVPAGYKFVPYSASAKVQPISKDAYVKMTLSDANNTVSNEAASFTQGQITTSTLTFSEEKAYTGDVTLSIYCYDGAKTGVTNYRLGTPVTISGVLEPLSRVLTTTQNMAGYKSFYDADKSYTLDENTTAYVAIQKKDNLIGLRKISTVPANTPVILKTTGLKENGTADPYYQMTLTASDDALAVYTGDNLLAVTAGAGEDLNVLRLGYNSEEGVAFYKWTVENNTTAGIVYLNLPADNASKMAFVFVEDEEADGIADVVEDVASDDAAVYNLAGQRVKKGAKGIIIKRGKKIVNK